MPSKFTFRPPTFEHLPQEKLSVELDKHLPRLFDAHAVLNGTAIKSPVFGGTFATNSGIATVTGSKLGIATGMSKVNHVVASLVAGRGLPLNLCVSAGVSVATVGAIDIYVFQPTSSGDNTPIPCTIPRGIHWYATGEAETTT